MKKRTAFLMSGVLLCVLATTAFAATPLKLIVNGKTIDQPLEMKGDVTYAPIRAIAESLGADVKWDGEQQQVIVDNTNAKLLQLQVQLLEDALAPTTPKQAAKTWAEGVQHRNGAEQFAVWSPELREKNGTNFGPGGNWVTGVSSPWVDGYELTDEQQVDDNTYTYRVVMNYATSTGPAGQASVVLTVHRYDNRWLVSTIGEAPASPDTPQQVKWTTELTLPTGKKISSPSYEKLSDKVNLRLETLNVVKSDGVNDVNGVVGNHAIVKSREEIKLPAGQATLLDVERTMPAASNDDTVTHEYWLVLLGPDSGNDMCLAYTLSTAYANQDADPAAVKKQLISVAQSWVLPQ
ncbi:copper amine oxidase N-terminal domain-containing protein [Tumebacillus flagellatus]|uniref:Copper amine oxidase-like N-terminal domain-containing protein n=1 Tax=Tumebacillus flagellatus TaxID=1157490 RepID=A0A074LKH3_9BACL|nr:copper amine oxidase N-terminal domain-containing protein [Tumebacillus flagellatus]KEO82606.1 hypothetical protein EL26_14570 [Tumebacillus flagellatus]